MIKVSIKDKFRKLFAPKPLPKPAPETEEQRLSREKADLEQAAAKAKEYEEKTGVKICRAFFIEDYLLRSVHLRNVERIEDYGSMLSMTVTTEAGISADAVNAGRSCLCRIPSFTAIRIPTLISRIMCPSHRAKRRWR